MRAILRMAWLCLALALPALPASAGSMKNETGAITARLDALKAPALGGSGEVIWVGIPNVQPEAAELTFAIEKPGHAAPEMQTQRLALTRGRASEATCALEAARPGQYRVTATLAMIVAGKTLVDERSLTLTVGMSQKTTVNAALEDIPALTVDAAAPAQGTVSNASGNNVAAWFRFDAATTGTYRVELSNIASALQQTHALTINWYGPNDATQLVGQYGDVDAKSTMQYGLALKRTGTYYIKVFLRRVFQTGAGSFDIRVSKLNVPAPVIKRFAINDGATASYSHSVNLNNDCSGAPAYTLVTESLMVNDETNYGMGFDWQPYDKAPSFFLSGADGSKQVHMFVKSQAGVVSERASDTIELIDYQELTADGIIHYQREITSATVHRYQFTVASEAYYDLWADHVAVRLYGPDSQTNLVAKSGTIPSSAEPARIIKKLAPGTYYVKVQARLPYASVSYGIKLTRSAGMVFVTDLKVKNASNITGTYGEPYVYTREITLASTVVGKPAQFKASLSPNFSGAKWETYHPEVRYRLSSGNGLKNIYFKVRDAQGRESAVAQVNVSLSELQTLELGKKVKGELKWNAADLNDMYAFKVKRPGQYFIEWTPVNPPPSNDEDHYLIALDLLNGLDASAKVITRRANTISPAGYYRWGVDLKPGTYYFRVLSWNQGWGFPYEGKYELRISSYSGPIALQTFEVTSRKSFIDEYQTWEHTASRKIVLNSYVLGSPKYYKVSESKWFPNAAWKPYAPSVEYTLSPGSGRKNLYFKVMDGKGRATRWEYDFIELEATPLTVNGNVVTAERKLTVRTAFEFTVSTAGDYTVQLASGSKPLTGLRFDLTGAANWNIISGQDRSTSGAPAAQYKLQPGTYYATVPQANWEHPADGNFEPYLGEFTARVTKD